MRLFYILFLCMFDRFVFQFRETVLFRFWDFLFRFLEPSVLRPEREEGISGIILGKQDYIDRVDSSDCDDNDVGDKELAKPLEQSHVYLSNAEVQINSGRIPIWQKSKIYFYTMSPSAAGELNFGKDLTGGEMEIETVPVHKVEMRRNDLLPVHPFRRFLSDWNGR
ncbi:hypothetical protein ACFX13_000254 [Malus domestica]